MKLRLRKTPVKAVVGLLLVIALVICIVLLLQTWEQQHYSFDPPEDDGDWQMYEDENDELDEVFYNGKWYSKKPNIDTVLCIGVDKYKDSEDQVGYVNTQQCDFLLAVIFDHNAKSYTALHLNRDTMTNITMLGLNGEESGSYIGQLALSHTYGTGGKDSCRNTVKAVSELLSGITIDSYIAVTMDAVAIANDAVGGVTLTVADGFEGVREELVPGETVTLTGDQALSYVRVRKGLDDSSNLSRMERQKQYISALKDAFENKAEQDPSVFLNTVLAVDKYMVSDCTANDLADMFNATSSYAFSGFKDLPGEAVVGEEFMEFYTDENALTELVIELFYEESAQ